MTESRVRIWTIISLIAITLFYGYGLYNEALFPFVSPVHTYVMTGMVLVGFVITLMLGAWRLRMPVWILASFGYATYTWLTTLWAANAGKAVDGAVTVAATVLLGLLGTVLPAWNIC